MPPMTLVQAKEEAVRRWGYQATAFITSGFYCVRSRYSNFGGAGGSFEEAFVKAEENEKAGKRGNE